MVHFSKLNKMVELVTVRIYGRMHMLGLSQGRRVGQINLGGGHQHRRPIKPEANMATNNL